AWLEGRGGRGGGSSGLGHGPQPLSRRAARLHHGARRLLRLAGAVGGGAGGGDGCGRLAWSAAVPACPGGRAGSAADHARTARRGILADAVWALADRTADRRKAVAMPDPGAGRRLLPGRIIGVRGRPRGAPPIASRA